MCCFESSTDMWLTVWCNHTLVTCLGNVMSWRRSSNRLFLPPYLAHRTRHILTQDDDDDEDLTGSFATSTSSSRCRRLGADERNASTLWEWVRNMSIGWMNSIICLKTLMSLQLSTFSCHLICIGLVTFPAARRPSLPQLNRKWRFWCVSNDLDTYSWLRWIRSYWHPARTSQK